jgi:predicted lipoprotein with Yx(FWY)xxD motif
MNGLEEDNGMQLLHPNLEPAENKPTSSLTVSYDRNYGRYLSSGTDEEGFTLYFNTADKAGKCKFKGDRTLWPSFYLGDGKITTHEINSTDIDTIVSSDGTLQTTYKGWPLYLYSGDAHPLEMNGLEEDNEMQLVSPIISPAQ